MHMNIEEEAAPVEAPATEAAPAPAESQWTAVGGDAAPAPVAVDDDSNVGAGKKGRVIFYGIVSLVPILLLAPFFVPRDMIPVDSMM